MATAQPSLEPLSPSPALETLSNDPASNPAWLTIARSVKHTLCQYTRNKMSAFAPCADAFEPCNTGACDRAPMQCCTRHAPQEKGNCHVQASVQITAQLCMSAVSAMCDVLIERRLTHSIWKPHCDRRNVGPFAPSCRRKVQHISCDGCSELCCRHSQCNHH
jgi:hypothetical protein